MKILVLAAVLLTTAAISSLFGHVDESDRTWTLRAEAREAREQARRFCAAGREAMRMKMQAGREAASEARREAFRFRMELAQAHREFMRDQMREAREAARELRLELRRDWVY
jgi:hypothetical protein